jgi:hypothetical protein
LSLSLALFKLTLWAGPNLPVPHCPLKPSAAKAKLLSEEHDPCGGESVGLTLSIPLHKLISIPLHKLILSILYTTPNDEIHHNKIVRFDVKSSPMRVNSYQ